MAEITRKEVVERPYTKPVVEVVKVFEDGKALYGILACGCYQSASGRRASP